MKTTQTAALRSRVERFRVRVAIDGNLRPAGDESRHRRHQATEPLLVGANGFYYSRESRAMLSTTASEVGEWLVLIYRIPTHPTRLRAKVLRRLHRIGAVPLQRSAVTLPYSSNNERALRLARHEIETMGGTALLFLGNALGCQRQLLALVAAEHDESSEPDDTVIAPTASPRRAAAER